MLLLCVGKLKQCSIWGNAYCFQLRCYKAIALRCHRLHFSLGRTARSHDTAMVLMHWSHDVARPLTLISALVSKRSQLFQVCLTFEVLWKCHPGHAVWRFERTCSCWSTNNLFVPTTPCACGNHWNSTCLVCTFFLWRSQALKDALVSEMSKTVAFHGLSCRR